MIERDANSERKMSDGPSNETEKQQEEDDGDGSTISFSDLSELSVLGAGFLVIYAII